jgi:hypothetical protein
MLDIEAALIGTSANILSHRLAVAHVEAVDKTVSIDLPTHHHMSLSTDSDNRNLGFLDGSHEIHDLIK